MSGNDSLPVIQPPDASRGRSPVERHVHGVVLAAGTSSRYGAENKLLSSYEGEPLVRHAVETVVEADVDDVTVVLGHDAPQVAATVEEFDDVSVRANPDYEQGLATSVRAGVRGARDADADAVLVALGDMPAVSCRTVDNLVAVLRQGLASAAAAAYEGTRGNPVVFDRRYFDALERLDGDEGGRSVLLASDDAVAVETGDQGVVFDVDRPEDR